MEAVNKSAIRNKSILVEILTGLLVLLFAYTATSKFLDYHKFVFQMRLAPFPLMKSYAHILGWLMPSIEMVVVLGLLISRLRLKALYTSVIMLLIFEIYIISMLQSGMHLPCTCGGIISKMGWKQHVVFNALFLIFGIIAIIQIKKIKFPLSEQSDEGNIQGLSRE